MGDAVDPHGAAGAIMNSFGDAFGFIFDLGNWGGSGGIADRIGEHLWYSLVSVAAGAAVAVPLGLAIGHFRRGEAVVVGLVNALRSVPSLGVLTYFVLLIGLGLRPPVIALVLLAVPPLLAGTYSGIANVDRAVVDAARAMGMTERQVLFRVEVPNALPLILGGLRNATLQVVATATIAAYVTLGGLGRYIFDGLSSRDYGTVVAGAILVAVLALVIDGLLAAAVWASVPGTGRLRKLTSRRRSDVTVGTGTG